MAFKLLDRARMSVSGSPGTGNITLGSAVTGYQNFSQAGLNDGDSFPYSLVDGNNWEFGVATYTFATSVLARTVTKTSAQNSNPLSLSNKTIVSACLRAEDVATATEFQGLTDVEVSPGAGNDGQVVYWNNTDAKFELKAQVYSDLTGAPAIPSNGSFYFYQLGDVAISPGPFVDGYVVTWHNTSSRFVLSPTTSGANLSALGDVSISGPTNGQALIYNTGASKWENGSVPGGSVATLSDVTLTSLGTNQILQWNGTAWVNVAIPTQTMVGLSDVQITTGSGVDGYSVTWNNTLGKFVLTNITGGGGGGGSSLAILNNGTSVDSAAVSLNFVNATSISTSSHAVTITLPTGGGGGGGYGSNFVPPDFSTLTAEQNLNSATITSRTSGVDLACVHVKPGSGTDGTAYCALENVPGSTFSAVIKMKTLVVDQTGDNSLGMGLMVRDGTSGYYSAVWLCPYSTVLGFNKTISTSGLGTFTNGSNDLKYTLIGEDWFLHVDYTGTGSLEWSLSKNGKDKVLVFTETNITNPVYVGICWCGNYGAIGVQGYIGPEYDVYHYYAGALGSNGL